jgi:hypothetical protein
MKTSDERARLLLALRCRAMALQIDRDLHDRLDRELKAMFPPQSRSDAEVLATLGDVAIPHLGYKKKCSVQRAMASIYALGLIGTKKSRLKLREFCEDAREPVYTELSRAIDPLEIVAVQEMLVSGRKLPVAIASQIAGLSALKHIASSKWLDLTFTNIDSLRGIEVMTELHTLILRGTRTVDLEPLSTLGGLQWLDLRSTNVSDLEPIAGLANLKHIDVRETKVSTVQPLEGLTKLECLD